MRTLLSVLAYTTVGLLFMFAYFFHPFCYTLMAIAFTAYGFFYLTRQLYRNFISLSSL